MTALHSSFTPAFFGHGPFDTMPDQPSDQDWQHHHQQNAQHNNYIPQMPMLTGQWAPQAQTHSNTQQPPQQQQQMLSMPGMDRRFYHENDSTTYMSYTTTGTSNNLISPGFGPPENAWSDIDMNTPSNFDSPNDPLDSYSQRLQPPSRIPSNSKHPHAHAPSLSPHQETPDLMNVDRPSMPGRAQTDPSVKTLGFKPSNKSPSIVKSQPPVSDEAESDDDFAASESNLTTTNSNHSKHPPPSSTNTTTPSNRGRKRQRIPHTAVERRYRENLNAHLERLRQTIPSLATRRSSAGLTNPAISSATSHHRCSEPTLLPSSAASDGAKPSKCEILNGAIEHIGAVGRENATLREEVKDLRARVEDLQRWYSATLRSAGGGQAGGVGVGFGG